MSKQRRKVLLVVGDDHPVFLHGLANVLKPYSDIRLVAQCHDGIATLNAIREFEPDVAMIDIGMSGLTGLDVLAAVTAEKRPTHVLFLTAAVSETQIMDAVAGGAKGIVFKSSTPEEIARSVRKVAAGRYQFPRELAETMRKRHATRQKSGALTPREVEVVRLLAKGLANKDIAHAMQLSEGTIKIHLHNIYRKLGVANRTAVVAKMVPHQRPKTAPDSHG